jgi:hypothetical protein
MTRRALAIGVALMLAVPVLASAAGPNAPRQDARAPSAQLQVAGSGAMTVQGRMVVHGTIPDQGQVIVIDRRGDATAYLAGSRLDFKRGRAIVRRAAGILFVTGSKVSVQVLGIDLAFSVAGNGQARLIGSGTYRLNAGPTRNWGRGTIKVTHAAERRTARRGDRRRAEKQRAEKQRAAKQRAAKQRAAKQRAAKQRAARERAAGERAAGERGAGERGVDRPARAAPRR